MKSLEMSRILAISVCLTVLVFQSAHAQLTVSNVHQYQVIQRDSTAATAAFTGTGTCRNGTTRIQVLLLNQSNSSVVLAATDLSGVVFTGGTNWQGTMAGLPVGGEYSARFRALNGTTVTDSVSIQNILVGDIWVCAGQSNMQGSGGSNTDPTHVHTCAMWSIAGTGTPACNSTWGNTVNTTGPTLTFASRLYALTGVPIGILFAAAGGTSLTDWFYAAGTNLFTTMSNCTKTAVNWKIGGFLWYQGENEDQQDTWATRFLTKFSRMRDTVRARSGNRHLPAIVVQLESWDGTSSYPLSPYSRWIRWPIIRDQQELAGQVDAYTATAPAWDCAGIHINTTDQGKLGPRCAASAIRIAYSNRSTAGCGPRFKTAWYQDTTRTRIVVQFQDVRGTLVNPADASHFGFYVMKPSVFNINDSTILDYGTDSYGQAAKMLKAITSVTTLDQDKVVVQLTAATIDSLTVGYGRHINLVNVLTPVTDSSGIPLRTFFNRPIARQAPSTAVKATTWVPQSEFISIHGTVLQLKTGSRAPVAVSIFSADGRLLKKFSTVQRSLDLRKGLSVGYYLIRAEMSGQQQIKKMVVN
jgi:hypothetical protein